MAQPELHLNNSMEPAPQKVPYLRWAGTILALGLLVYLLWQQGWEEIWQAVRSIPPGWLAGAGVLIAVSRLAVASRWHALLRSVGVPIDRRDSLGITFAGLFASNFLPTTIGGDVVRLAMALQLGFDRVVCAASIAVDRLVGMAGMASAIPMGLGPLVDFAGALRSESGLPLAGVPLPAGGRLWGRTRHLLQRLLQAVGLWAKAPRGLLTAFGLTWVHQGCLFGIIWLALHGMGETIGFGTIGGLWAFTYFVTLLPISINGLGLQELSMTFIFSHIGGVSVTSAATAALVVRTLQVLGSLPGVVFLPAILAKTQKEK